MIKVLGHRVLIKVPDPKQQVDLPETLKNSKFEIALGADEKRWFEASQEGTVVQVGPMAWKSQALGYGLDAWEPWVKAGDKIRFVQYAKDVVVDPDTKEKLFVINDVDVLVKIEEV